MIAAYSLSYFYIGYTLAYFTAYGPYFLNIYYGIPLVGFGRVFYIALVYFGAAAGVLLSKIIV